MNEKLFKKAEEAEKRKLAAEVTEDFQNRRAARRELENKWRINLNFLSGKQFTGINAAGEIGEEEPAFFFHFRNVFNHVLPVYDARLCKLAKIRPTMSVRAATDDNSDIKTAELTSKILNATCARIDEDKLISSATAFSEATGTAFYEVGWNPDEGTEVGFDENGSSLKEGDAYVQVVSPFEILAVLPGWKAQWEASASNSQPFTPKASNSVSITPFTVKKSTPLPYIPRVTKTLSSGSFSPSTGI